MMVYNFLEGFYLSITKELGLPGHASLSMHCHQEGAIVELTEEFIEITYADTGLGITLEMRSKIFQPFVTSNRAKGASGLGLFQVFNWVTQLLQGEIECGSTPYITGDESTEHGTTFLIRIPRSLQ